MATSRDKGKRCDRKSAYGAQGEGKREGREAPLGGRVQSQGKKKGELKESQHKSQLLEEAPVPGFFLKREEGDIGFINSSKSSEKGRVKNGKPNSKLKGGKRIA